jgi:hypothetical protein
MLSLRAHGAFVKGVCTIMEVPPYVLGVVKDGLQTLKLDKETQIRIWTGQTDLVLDFVETMCGLFDDTGLSCVIEQGEVAAHYGEELGRLLVSIDEISDRIEPYEDPVKIANSPEMAEIRVLAGQALLDPIFKDVKTLTQWDLYTDST